MSMSRSPAPIEEHAMTKTRGRKPKMLQIAPSRPQETPAKEPTERPSNVQQFRVALSIMEFRSALGIGKTLFFRLQKEGRIRTIKIGTRTLVPIDQLAELLAQVAV
jgi:hypothetical protein